MRGRNWELIKEKGNKVRIGAEDFCRWKGMEEDLWKQGKVNSALTDLRLAVDRHNDCVKY